MSKDEPKPTREERLAAKLRENLRRRKAQKQAHQQGHARPTAGTEQPPLPKDESKS